jgi:hypothetical protein
MLVGPFKKDNGHTRQLKKNKNSCPLKVIRATNEINKWL